jgi:hypothetical protein
LVVIAQGLEALQTQITLLDHEIAGRAKADPVAKRLMTIPGIGPVIATALVALAPAASTAKELHTPETPLVLRADEGPYRPPVLDLFRIASLEPAIDSSRSGEEAGLFKSLGLSLTAFSALIARAGQHRPLSVVR